MASSNGFFQLLGFPNEDNIPNGEIVYQCHFTRADARICIWITNATRRYAVNLYHARRTDTILTHRQDRYDPMQSPIMVDDAFEAQLAINYLVQKHLPTEVTNDERNAGSGEEPST